MIVLFLIFAAWIGLGWLGAAYLYNYFQLGWPGVSEKDEPDDAREFLWVAAGPATLLTVMFYAEDDMRQFGPRFTRYKYINGVRQP